ncbi:RimJ/RimL family protein N-acetyltransferase [Natronocella acetinitrilica]|uniref:RimJ/RimL family protein N-acetyltransferase n=1 Tax=Natronocella acetinitrilica TaxID=414046 RepID=A0AAE3G539_9GAMM|nr:GNAT family protein [Natronocella acetinitrilica]MCP1674906.1 RimJ/RimL family protein N-acetyltransferase [Natronocella acetinitrilica]
MSERWVTPVTLTGQHVLLEPMALEHVDELSAAASDGRLWELWYTTVAAPEAMAASVSQALARRERDGEMPFIVREAADGRPIGSTRFCNVEAERQRLEIGYTWYSASYQRTAVNTECKLLLLGHAFETLGAIAVEFRTHWFNHASREAIARLGAKQDGVLRNHQRLADGSYRDTVVFSIINHEWAAVKQHLRFRLARHQASSR